MLGAFAALASAVPALAFSIAAASVAVALSLWTIARSHRWVLLFCLSALLLPPLPFAAGNSGPHPSVAFAGLGVVAGLARLSRWKVPADSLTAAFFLFVCALVASLAPAAVFSGVEIAAGSLVRVCLFGISVYLFFYVRSAPAPHLAGDPFRLARLLFAAAVAVSLFACLDFYLQFPAPAGFGAQFIWLDSGVYRRAQGLFYEASTLGNFCAFFLVMIAVALFRPAQARPARPGVLIAGGVVLGAALILSYSRASLLSLIPAGIAVLWLHRSRLRFTRPAVGAAVGAAAGVAALLTLFPAFTEMYLLRLAASAKYFTSAPEIVLSGRLAAWRAIAGFIAEHPWHAFIGVGYKTLPYSSFIGQPVVADNMYLSLLAETGLLGLSALLFLCYVMLQASLRAARGADVRRSFFGAWFFCFWVGQMFQMFSGDLLTYWRVLPVYFLVLAIAVRE